jgi:HD-like signal output (HDOD) protein
MTQKLPSKYKLQKKIMDSIKSIPPMNQVIDKARKVIENPDSSFEELATLIEKDQALAVNVIKIANSAYYRRVTAVSSIKEAVVVLGFETLDELITIACVSPHLHKRLRGYDMKADSVWWHSLASASGAKIIARMTDPALENEAFTAGLIHDVGKLVLDRYVYERKDNFIEHMSDDQVTFYDAEKGILGFDHAEIAEKICKKWNFPKPITTAIKYHHNPWASRNSELSYIVHASDQIAAWAEIGAEDLMLDISDELLERLGLRVEDVEQIIADVTECADNIVGK